MAVLATAVSADLPPGTEVVTPARAAPTIPERLDAELRTSLALILEPAAALLADAAEPLSPAQREQVALMHRHAVHLFKLLDAGPDNDIPAPPAPGPDEGPASQPLHDAQATRILIADDHPDLCRYLTRLLGRHWQVECVGDGRAALDAARDRRPDLVIADVLMPGLDGYEVVRALRADPATAAIPVILLSGSVSIDARVEGLRAGAADYLVKPFRGRELVARVQSQLDLSLARRKVEESIASRDAFFAAASHELRNPINSVQLQLLGTVRRAEAELHGPATEWLHVRLGRITAQVSRLVRLVDTLLDVSRVASGRLPLVLEEVDLAEVVVEAIDRLDVSERGQIVTAIQPALGRWDRLRLDQVVTNLVSNALKYGEGGRIEVVVTADAERARLEVTDHGIGIAPHHQARIFERFERAVSGSRYAGFGLGLWITSRIVEESGGTMSLRSELGVGSTFIVELPRAPRSAAGASA